MDYEKAYKEALEQAKKELAVCGNMDCDAARLIFKLFSQLRENEDERMIKSMTRLVKAFYDCNFPTPEGFERKDLLAWLEKQKDANKAIEAVERIDKYIDEHVANAHDMKDSNPDKKYYRGWDDALGKMSEILQDVYSNEKQKEQKVDIDKLRRDIYQSGYNDGYQHGKEDAQKEQKPAEWSEFDKGALEDAICAADTLANDKSFNKSNPNLAKAFRVAKDWLKSLPERFVLQPKQEWSEEDERMLNLTKTQLRILQSHLNHTHSENMADTEYSSRLLQIEKCVSWLDIRLKSLRPQPNTVPVEAAIKFGGREYERGVNDGKQSEKNRHWKPSEEQMEALNALNCHGDLSYVGQQKQLISLYNDLKLI